MFVFLFGFCDLEKWTGPGLKAGHWGSWRGVAWRIPSVEWPLVGSQGHLGTPLMSPAPGDPGRNQLARKGAAIRSILCGFWAVNVYSSLCTFPVWRLLMVLCAIPGVMAGGLPRRRKDCSFQFDKTILEQASRGTFLCRFDPTHLWRQNFAGFVVTFSEPKKEGTKSVSCWRDRGFWLLSLPWRARGRKGNNLVADCFGLDEA